MQGSFSRTCKSVQYCGTCISSGINDDPTALLPCCCCCGEFLPPTPFTFAHRTHRAAPRARPSIRRATARAARAYLLARAGVCLLPKGAFACASVWGRARKDMEATGRSRRAVARGARRLYPWIATKFHEEGFRRRAGASPRAFLCPQPDYHQQQLAFQGGDVFARHGDLLLLLPQGHPGVLQRRKKSRNCRCRECCSRLGGGSARRSVRNEEVVSWLLQGREYNTQAS